MKKLIFLAFAIITLIPAYSQTIPGLTLGPKIGATFSRYNLDELSLDEKVRSSFHWGAFVRFGARAYIQPELLFMKKSGLLIDPLADASEQKISLRTIDVPVLFGIKVVDIKLTNVRIFAGPIASIVVNKEIEVNNWEDALTKDDIRGANWGIQFGAGADLLIFTVDLRYELGMGDYLKNDGLTMRNDLMTLSVGWKIL
ncbi:MAG TPA: porin family protein [Lentimicrobium sp.]|nr:porin family protein [Lentimicrobium sp.]